MSLRTEFEQNGNWMFRWRSFLPLALLLPLGIDLREMSWLGASRELQNLWQIVCLLVSFSGLLVRAATVGYTPEGTSGRNTKSQIANQLNTTGLYSIVRHPLYVGNLLIWLGIAMFCHNLHLVIIVLLSFWVYYERIMFAEEEFLRQKFQQKFEQWAAKTPAFLPHFRGWKPSNRPFSFRKVLRQEYTGFGGIVLVFCGLELLQHALIEHTLRYEPFWAALAILGAAVYLVLRTLKRHTSLLAPHTRKTPKPT